MAYVGIDYGLFAGSNRNVATGIHYGVISQHSVGEAWYEGAEADYGEASCPVCGNAAVEYDDDEHGEWLDYTNHGGNDYACEHCEHTLDSQDCFGDEPQGYSYSGDGYELTDCLDSAIFVIDSLYYAFTQFCSPCVPGAGDLDSPMADGVKTYCLGHEWFEEGRAPYPVYSVATGAKVLP